MAGESASMDLKVLISVLQSGNALDNLTKQAQQLAQQLTKLQTQAGVGQVGASAEAAAVGLSKSARAAQEAGTALASIEGVANRVTQAFRLMTGGFLAFESVRFIKGLADTAARTEVLGTVLHVVAQNAGYTSDQIDTVDKSVQRLGITAQASRQSLTQFLQAGLKLEYATKLARAAQDLAVIADVNSSVTFERLIGNIQRLNTVGLRYMGIIVNREQAERKYKLALGDTTKALSQQQQQEALTIEVLAKAAVLEGTYMTAMNDAAKQLTSLQRLTETYREELGNSLLPAYSAIIANVTLMFEKLIVQAREFSANEDRARSLANTMDSLSKAFGAAAVFLMDHLEAIIRIVTVYVEFRLALMAINAAWTILVTGWKAWGLLLLGIDYVLKMVLLFQAWEKGILSVNLALNVLRAGSMKAAADLLVTAAAAETTTASVGALAAAWGSLSALMLIPVIGYIIAKINAQRVEEEKLPVLERARIAKGRMQAGRETPEGVGLQLEGVFEDWKRAYPDIVKGLTVVGDEVKTNAALWKEFNAEIDKTAKETPQVLSTQAKEIGDAKTELDKANIALEKLLHPPPTAPPVTPAEIVGAREALAAAAEAVQKKQEQAKKDFEATITSATVPELKAQIARVGVLQEAVKAVNANKQSTQVQINLATSAYALEKDRLAVMMKVNEEQMKGVGITDTLRKEAEKARAQAGETLQQTVRDLQALDDARRALLGGKFEVAPEGLVSTAFGKQVGGFKTVAEDAKKELVDLGKLSPGTIQTLIKGMDDLGLSSKTALDFSKLKEAITTIQGLQKAAPGLQGAAQTALKNAVLGLEQEARAAKAPLIARDLEFYRDHQKRLADALNEELDITKTANQELEAQNKHDYDHSLMTTQEYFDARRDMITSQYVAENATALRAVATARGEADRTLPGPARDQAETRVLEAEQKVRDLQRKFRQDTAGANREQAFASQDITRSILEMQLQTAASYGNQDDIIREINHKYDQLMNSMHVVANSEGEAALKAAKQLEINKVLLDMRNRSVDLWMRELEAQRRVVEISQAQTEATRERVQTAEQLGTITPVDAMRRRNALAQQDIADDRVLLATYQAEIAKKSFEIEERKKETIERMQQAQTVSGKAFSPTSPETLKAITEAIGPLNTDLQAAILKTIQLDGAMEKLSRNMESYAREFQLAFSGALSTMLTDLVMRTQKMSDVFKTFAQSLEREIVGSVMKQLATKISGELAKSGLFSGLAKMLGLGTAPDGSREHPLFVVPLSQILGPGLPGLPGIPGKLGQPPPGLPEPTSVPDFLSGLPKLSLLGGTVPDGTASKPFNVLVKNFPPAQKPVNTTTSSPSVLGSLVSQVAMGIGFGLVGRGGGKPKEAGYYTEDSSQDFSVRNPNVVTSAAGGVVSGPGTGTSDSIHAMVSTGEHIMPAAKAAKWLPLLEGIRLGRLTPAFALGGVVSLQSIAIPSLIPRHYASGGVVVSDGGASSVMTGSSGPSQMVVSLHPNAMNMTLREWLEQEVVRQHGRR